MRVITVLLLICLALASFPAAAQSEAREGEQPAVSSSGIDFVMPRVTWRLRNVIGNERLLRWRVVLNGKAFGPITLTDASERGSALSLNAVEGSDSQKASANIPKNIDPTLTPEERTALKTALRVRMPVYRVSSLGSNEASRRQIFECAKALGADTIVVPFDAIPYAKGLLSSASKEAETGGAFDPAAIDQLASEYAINLAFHSAQPEVLMTMLRDRGSRLGVAADTGLWLEQEVKPAEAIGVVKGRLMYVSLRDRSELGPNGRDVLLGSGIGDLKTVMREVSTLGQRPILVVIDATTAAKSYAEVAKNVEAFEVVAQSGLGPFVTERSRTFPIRGLQNTPPEQRAKIEADTNRFLIAHPMMNEMNVNLPAAVRQGIEAAVPSKPVVTPKKPRKVLVIDACVANMSHNSIPHGNLMLELMAKKTGAFKAEFSNDFNKLKYPAIKQYDAIFLNNTVGELFPDPEVRESLLRYVREGGGLGGLHGATYASRNWKGGIGELLGAQDCPHGIEPGTLVPDDPDSPMMKPFGGKPLELREEYYRFPHEGETATFSRDKVRVLLRVEFPISADGREGRNGYKRPNHDYPVSWVRSFGEGRTFYCSLGHMAETFQTPQVVGHILAGIQFLTGDLEANTTPKPKLTASTP